jgi:hypothetical protein
MAECARTFCQVQQQYDLQPWVSSGAAAGAAGADAAAATEAAAVPDDVLLQLLKRQLVVMEIRALAAKLQHDQEMEQLKSLNTRKTQVTMYLPIDQFHVLWVGFGQPPGHVLPPPYCQRLCLTREITVSCAGIPCWSWCRCHFQMLQPQQNMHPSTLASVT